MYNNYSGVICQITKNNSHVIAICLAFVVHESIMPMRTLDLVCVSHSLQYCLAYMCLSY